MDILDRPIIALSDKDAIDIRTLNQGCFITGSPGSGKTSSSGKQLAYGLLKVPTMGGLVLTAKAEETQNWTDYAKACGRLGDLILFNEKSGLCFDPMFYEWTRPGRGAGDLESTVDLFTTLVDIGKKQVSGQSHEPFWDRGTEKVMRNVIRLIDLAGEIPSIAKMDRVVRSLPTQLGMEANEQYKATQYAGQLMNAIIAKRHELSEDHSAISNWWGRIFSISGRHLMNDRARLSK
jgi:hypothetical protein